MHELTQTATAGVNKLRQSLNRPSGDKRAPTARALAMSAKLGKKAKLRFRLSDNSGKARALVRVYGPQYALFASLTMPLRKVGARGSVQSVSWRVPVTLGTGKFSFCVLRDRQGREREQDELREAAPERRALTEREVRAARLRVTKSAPCQPDCSRAAAVKQRPSSHEQRLHPESVLVDERHAGFQGEVAKDELAKLAPRRVPCVERPEDSALPRATRSPAAAQSTTRS